MEIRISSKICSDIIEYRILFFERPYRRVLHNEFVQVSWAQVRFFVPIVRNNQNTLLPRLFAMMVVLRDGVKRFERRFVQRR